MSLDAYVGRLIDCNGLEIPINRYFPCLEITEQSIINSIYETISGIDNSLKRTIDGLRASLERMDQINR